MTDRIPLDDLTSDALDQLYTELDNLRLDKTGHDAVSAAWARKLREAEAELTALKSITDGYCPACGRGDCSPTAAQWYEQQQRAEKAGGALERVRVELTAIERDRAHLDCECEAVSYDEAVRRIRAALDEHQEQ